MLRVAEARMHKLANRTVLFSNLNMFCGSELFHFFKHQRQKVFPDVVAVLHGLLA